MAGYISKKDILVVNFKFYNSDCKESYKKNPENSGLDSSKCYIPITADLYPHTGARCAKFCTG